MKFLAKPTIFSQLLFYVLPIALLPLTLVITLTYFQAKNSLQKEGFNYLQTVLARHANQIEFYINERKNDVTTFSKIPNLIQAFVEFETAFKSGGTGSSEYALVHRELDPFLSSIRETYGYEDMFLVSREGDILLSLASEEDLGSNLKVGLYENTGLASVFEKVLVSMKPEISSFDFYPPTKKAAGFIAAPFLHSGRSVGVLIVQINSRELYKIVNDYTGLKQTGETVVAAKRGNAAVFMAPLRFDSHAALKRKVPLGSSEALPIQQAVQNKPGSGFSIDYRNKEVLAAWKYLPIIQWGMVVKIDTTEAFASITELQRGLIFIGTFTIFMIIGITLVVARSFSGPIVRLTQITQKVAGGELTHKADVKTQNEIGQLAGAFNTMTDKLQDSYDRLEQSTLSLRDSLDESEEAWNRIDGILMSIGDALIVTDIQNKIVLMNRPAEKIFGISLSKAITRPIDTIIQDKTLQEQFRTLPRQKDPFLRFSFKMEGEDPDHLRIMRARTSMFKDKAGRKHGRVIIVEDVTREREIDRMKTEFISTAAHELRTPLTSIQGFSELLLVNKNLEPEKKDRFLSHINKESMHLANIINDLLDISRIESGKGFSLDRASCDIGKTIEGVVSYFEECSDEHRFKVILPPEPAVWTVDQEKIEQVLQNLLGNAVKYSPNGGLIQVRVDSQDCCHRISVQDQGIGMTADQLGKVFEKFYRADASNAAIEGTGLGMTIVQNIVNAHGGEVQVSSEFGKGTNVNFTIPTKMEKSS